MIGMVFAALGRMAWKLIRTVLWITFQLLRLSLEIVKIILLFSGSVLKLFLIVLHAGNF